MTDSPLAQCTRLGQSIWLDHAGRNWLTGDRFHRMVEEEILTGVTTSPAWFREALDHDEQYEASIRRVLTEQPGACAEDLYEAIVVEDLGKAADVLSPVYNRTRGKDGFVAVHVTPGIVHSTEGILNEARRLFKAIDRPNVMVIVPSTEEGYTAASQMIGEGLSVSLDLVFSLDGYERAADAYIEGLEQREKAGSDLSHVASVACFFLSRIDKAVDDLLPASSDLHSRIAVAMGKFVYERFQSIFHSPRFNRLKEDGARVQRLLWASTTPKMPHLNDLHYVEPLIGPDTINTMTPHTLEAYKRHGVPRLSVIDGLEEAERDMEALNRLGLDLNLLANQLRAEAENEFSSAFDEMIRHLAAKRDRILSPQSH